MNEETQSPDYDRIDAKISEAMRGAGNRGPLVMVAEISEATNEPKRIVQMRLHSMSLKKRVFRHDMAGDTTWHLEPKEPHVEKPVPERNYDRTKVERDDEEVSATFDDATYAEMEALILKAIDVKKRTLPQIKEHAGFSKDLDISDVIVRMCMEKKIRREENGLITAFFRYKDKPSRFWIGADRTVEAIFDKTYQVRPADLEQKKAAELLGHGSEDNAAGKLLGDTKTAAKPTINAGQLELLAESIQSAESIAKAFGLVNASALQAKLRSSDELKDAFDRGRRKFAQRKNPTFDSYACAKPIGVREEEKPSQIEPKPSVLDQKPQEITQNPTGAGTIPAAREEKTMATGTATGRDVQNDEQPRTGQRCEPGEVALHEGSEPVQHVHVDEQMRPVGMHQGMGHEAMEVVPGMHHERLEGQRVEQAPIAERQHGHQDGEGQDDHRGGHGGESSGSIGVVADHPPAISLPLPQQAESTAQGVGGPHQRPCAGAPRMLLAHGEHLGDAEPQVAHGRLVRVPLQTSLPSVAGRCAIKPRSAG